LEALGRIVGIDFGEARIGLSISDERGIFASPLPCLKNLKKMETTAQLLMNTLNSLGQLDAIVIGLPLMMNGTEGVMAQQVKKFSECLKTFFGGEILFWDERLTTAGAEKILKEAKVNRKKRSQSIDSLSAVLILQNYLDYKKLSIDQFE
jgi:putative Holliday junction resolvase